jgi:hypothetical protein
MEKIYSREIKYLAYNIQEKEIFEVKRIDLIDKWIYKKDSNQCFKFEDVEILQFTNNQDMDEKDIYEGHVLFNPETNRYFEVLFRADRFMIERRLTEKDNPGYELADLYPANEDLKIVGFIFEKDLLEKVGYSSIHEEKTQN